MKKILLSLGLLLCVIRNLYPDEMVVPPIPSTPSSISSTILDNSSQTLLDSLITEALTNNASITSLRDSIKAAHEMIELEGALQDPMLEVMMQDVNFPSWTVGDMEMSMVGVQITQPLPYPGKLEKRKKAAAAQEEIKKRGLSRLQTALVMQIRILYAKLYTIDSEQKALDMGKELLEMLKATVSARYSSGQAEQEAVIKAQLESSRLQEKITDTIAERKVTVAALSRLLNKNTLFTINEISALPIVQPATNAWSDAALTFAPELLVKKSEITAANRKADVARAEINPDFSIGMGVFSRGGFDQVVTLQAGIELPLWRKYKQRPKIRAAENEVNAAKNDLKDTESFIRSEIIRLQAEWQKAEKQIVLYTDAIIPQTSAALDAARSSYLTGRGDYSAVIEDFREWLDARTGLNKREAERFTTWAELEALTNPVVQSLQEKP